MKMLKTELELPSIKLNEIRFKPSKPFKIDSVLAEHGHLFCLPSYHSDLDNNKEMRALLRDVTAAGNVNEDMKKRKENLCL
jgi:hypothetical protein